SLFGRSGSLVGGSGGVGGGIGSSLGGGHCSRLGGRGGSLGGRSSGVFSSGNGVILLRAGGEGQRNGNGAQGEFDLHGMDSCESEWKRPDGTRTQHETMELAVRRNSASLQQSLASSVM